MKKKLYPPYLTEIMIKSQIAPTSKLQFTESVGTSNFKTCTSFVLKLILLKMGNPLIL